MTQENDRLCETLRDLRLVLERLAAANEPPEVDTRRHFYKIFNREADDYDRDFHKKYDDDLNNILIFAGLFSAVASAFIVDIQQELRPDYTAMSFTALTVLLNATSGILNQLNATSDIPSLNKLDVPVQSGPNPSTIQVQSILFASLAIALLAAFLAMLAKQWLNLYDEGSLIDRTRHRERRMRGMITWRFKLIMECLPVVMQISLLLLGYALTRYLWDLSRTVSAVIATFTAFGVLFYLFIVFAATVWKTCPFQTPASLLLRHIAFLVRKHHPHRLHKTHNSLSAVTQFRKLNQSFVTATLARSTHEELGPLPRTLTPATTMVDVEDEESTQSSDSNCISTMFRFAGAPDAIIALTGFIPEVNWTSNVRRVPLLQVYNCLRSSFEFLKDGRVRVRPGMRAQAYGSAKALLHFRVQRLCAGATDDTRTIAPNIGFLLVYRPGEDHELESTLQVLDAVFNKEKEIRWQEFVFGDAHYRWLSHVLRCRAWETLRAHETPTEEVLGFVRHSLSKEPLPPLQVIADCLLVVSMMIRRLPELDDEMLIEDKSEEIEETLNQIYLNLEQRVSPHSPTSSLECAIEVLELVKNLKQENLYTNSYQLFLKIMADAGSDDRFRRPAELSLVGAFKWGTSRPDIGDPAPLIRFLEHCLLEQEGGIEVDLPVERVMLALAGAPSEVISEGIARVDFTQPLFFNAICRALRNGAPYLLRRATLIFLRHLDAQIFDANKTFSEDQTNGFISGWSSSVEQLLEEGHGTLLPKALFATLMGMLDSPFWRRHIPWERWGILTWFGVVEEDLPPSFYRCAKNPAVIRYLESSGARGSSVLFHWAGILWGQYPDLSEDVRMELESVARRMAVCSFPSNYLTIVKEQTKRIQQNLDSHAWSLGKASVERLRERLESLKKAKEVLTSFQR